MSTSRSIRVDAGGRGPTAWTVWYHVVAAAMACIASAPAAAHGFGQRYDLPLPLSLYLFGAAAAIVFSFVVIGVFVRRAPGTHGYPHVDLRGHSLGRLIASCVLVLKLLVLGLALVTVLAGFWGNSNPYQNIAPTMVWVIGWVGFVYVSAFIGNVWAAVNPWRTLFDLAEWLHRRVHRGHDLSLHLVYPAMLGVWPAFVLLLAFSWTELVYPSPAVPAHVAWLLVVYSVLTWAGMALYGSAAWLRHGELFSVYFSLFARFAPTEVRVLEPALCEQCDADCRSPDGPCINCYDCLHRAGSEQWALAVRPFGAGLLDSRPVSTSMAAFVLLVLSTVLYDGFLGTPEWTELEAVLLAHMPGSGDVTAIALRTIGLAVFWAFFFAAFLAVSAMMSAAVAGQRSTWDLARSMSLTLVPIATAYHLAHYLTYLLIQGQYIIPLLSDPFGYGWDLFRTAGFRVDIGIVGARFTWFTAVAAIVAGHIVAVYLAHVRSMRSSRTRSAALRSEVPLTALMVIYTFISLSILAEPITERRPSAQPAAAATGAVSVPEEAVLPEPGTGRLRPVGAGKVARQRLTYRVLGSTFHDGTPMSVADILYAYMFVYRWGVRNETDASHYDPFVAAATAAMRRHLIGVRFVGTDTKSKSFRVGDVNVVRELFIIDVYTTSTPEDPEQDAALAPPWSTLPWHLMVLMEQAVDRGWAGFSQAEAERRGVEWLDLVRSDRLNRQLAALVATFARDGYRPDSLHAYVSVDEARRRWAALAAFFHAHGHFLVTNGPYELKAWSADAVSLSVFRDLSYPLGVGSYDSYAIPRQAFISKVESGDDRITLFVDIETITKFQRSYEIVREPLQSVSPDIRQRAAPQCRYMVLDSEGHVVLAGTATAAENATFQVVFAGKLAPGLYTMLAEITVNGNAMNADIQRIPVRVRLVP